MDFYYFLMDGVNYQVDLTEVVFVEDFSTVNYRGSYYVRHVGNSVMELAVRSDDCSAVVDDRCKSSNSFTSVVH